MFSSLPSQNSTHLYDEPYTPDVLEAGGMW